VRRHTPRAALLSALAGVGITFIAMGFIFQIFSSPLVAVFPALLVLIGYAGRVRWPWGLPTGFIAVVAGTLAAWLLRGLHLSPMPVWPQTTLHFYFPVPIVGGIFALLTDVHVWKYAAYFVPMAVLNVIGSMMNLESAEAAGDKFDTRSSLLANGVSAVVGVFFGNPFRADDLHRASGLEGAGRAVRLLGAERGGGDGHLPSRARCRSCFITCRWR